MAEKLSVSGKMALAFSRSLRSPNKTAPHDRKDERERRSASHDAVLFSGAIGATLSFVSLGPKWCQVIKNNSLVSRN